MHGIQSRIAGISGQVQSASRVEKEGDIDAAFRV
jgi:hypothetical protein